MFYKYKYLLGIGIFLLLISFSSCKQDLNLNPRDQYASNAFWTSESNVNLALTGLYRGDIHMDGGAEFQPTDWWSYNGLIFLDLATDNAYDRRGDNSTFNKLTNGALTANNVNLDHYWTHSYSRIATCNYFLENIGKAKLSDSVAGRMIAEARFLRACQYLYLSTYYGAVPLITHTLSLDSANNETKVSQKAVQDYVEKEFTEAADHLPRAADLPSSERGRATKQADLAFLGRLYLTEKNWQMAADTYKKIMDYGDNIIDPDYPSLFNGTNEDSKEIIFATQYLVDLAPNGMLQHFYPRLASGWSIFCPLGSLAESYDFKDGTTFSYNSPEYNPNNIGENRDPRLKYNILYSGEPFKGMTYDSNPDDNSLPDQLTLSKQATRTGYCMLKYCYEGFSGGDLQNTGIDLPIIRYAEVLLSYLEAKIHLGGINQTLLDATINKVRGRADVDMPPVTELDPVKLLVILKKERRNELAFEGIRLWDLYRWDEADSALEGKFYGASYPGSAAVATHNTKYKSPDPLGQGRWYVTTKNFNPEDYPWPIPQSEVNINPKLK